MATGSVKLACIGNMNYAGGSAATISAEYQYFDTPIMDRKAYLKFDAIPNLAQLEGHYFTASLSMYGNYDYGPSTMGARIFHTDRLSEWKPDGRISDYRFGGEGPTAKFSNRWVTISDELTNIRWDTELNFSFKLYAFSYYGVLNWSTLAIHTNTGVNKPYLEVSYSPTRFSVAGAYPKNGSQAVRTETNRFGWTLGLYDHAFSTYGEVKQQSGLLEWREKGASEIHAVPLGMAGTAGFVDIPANTFATSEVEWRVTLESNAGATGGSGWIGVTTDDSLSSVDIVSPIGVVVEDVDGIDFKWQHVIDTGTSPTGFHIQVSEDQGSTWVDVVELVSSEQTYHAEHNKVPSGAVLWHVRTKNSLGQYGSWSAPAGIIVRAAPDIPNIVFVDDKPRVRVGWQSHNQQAFRVVYSDDNGTVHDTKMMFGTEKEYQIPFYLVDGEYQVQVQIQNASGLTSGFATVQTTVINRVAVTMVFEAKSTHLAIDLHWGFYPNISYYYVLRDGTPIARIESTGQSPYTYVDYFCCGEHEYILMAVDSDDYYTKSKPVIIESRPQYAYVIEVDSVDPILLKYNQDGPESISKSGGCKKEYVLYANRERPVAYVEKGRQIQNSFRYKLLGLNSLKYDAALRKKIEKLDGKLVFFKNNRGERIFGTMDIQNNTIEQHGNVAFQIVETDYHEEVNYL